MDTLNRSILTDYSSRMLDRFLPTFPEEVIYSIDNSENYFHPDGDRLKGGWVIEWLCPAGGYEWNVHLRSTLEGRTEQLTIRWGNDHIHFGYWTNTKSDEEVDECLNFLNGIFQERIWYVSLYNEKEIFHRQMYKVNEIESILVKKQAVKHEVKTWRGTFDKTVLSV